MIMISPQIPLWTLLKAPGILDFLLDGRRGQFRSEVNWMTNLKLIMLLSAWLPRYFPIKGCRKIPRLSYAAG